MSFEKRGQSRKGLLGMSTLPSKGQMPFSMIAVILLILAGAGAAMVYGVGESRHERDTDLSQMQELQTCAILESSEVEQMASEIASEVSRSNGLGNESELRERFRSTWQEAIRSTYPERRGDSTIRMVNSSIEIRLLRLSEDNTNTVKQGVLSDQMGVASATMPIYVELVGKYTLKVERNRCSIARTFEIQRSIYDPSPFLANRLQTFESAFEGGKNEIENLVRYQLAALSQDRLLRGGGSGSIGEMSSASSLITEQDVRNAMNLAIVIEGMKVFRAHDENYLKDVLAQFPCDETTRAHVETLLHYGGQLDVADLFLLLNDGGHYPLRQILAQSIYSSTDVLVLRWLDYLHIIDLLKAVEQIGSGVQITVLNVIETLTGIDLMEGAMAKWMSERFLEAGVHDYQYRWLHYSSSDCYVSVEAKSLGFRNDLGEELEIIIEGNYDIDFPPFDVLSSPVWKDFLLGYKSSTFQFAKNLELFIKSVAMNVASSAKLADIRLELDPRDDEDYLDEIHRAIVSEMNSHGEWFEEALWQADNDFVIKDPLGQALTVFARANWRELFQLNSSVDSAEADMAESIVGQALAATSYVSDSTGINEIGVVKNAIQSDEGWGVDSSIRRIFENDVEPRLDLFDRVFGNLPWEGQSTPLQRMIVTMASNAIDGIPGIKVVLGNLIERQMDDLRDQAHLRSDKVLILIPDSEEFSFMTENGVYSHESLTVRFEVPWILDPSMLLVDVYLPDDFDSQEDLFPNRHLTDPLNTSLCPFESGFGIVLSGLMRVEIAPEHRSDSLLVRTDSSMALSLPFGFRSNFSSSSGWPLLDVEYRPTMTLDKHIAQFLDGLWGALMEVLQLIGDACNQVFNFLKDCLSTLLSYCMQAVELLSDFLTSLAQGLRDMVQGAIGSIIKGLAMSISATMGQIRCAFSIGGLDMVLETSIPDMQFGRSRDLLKWTVCVPLMGANLSFGVRIVEMVRSGLDVLGFCKMAGQDWQAAMMVDPLMLIQDHLIEAEGVFPDFSIELKAPEIVQYEKRSFRLSDIPVVGTFLSRIPTPIPGLLASVDAGFEVKYDNERRDHIVVNEVEINPPGPDSGNEWVELYNPTEEAIDISGWSLETLHGEQMSVILGDHVIESRSHYIHQFDAQFLDNGGESQLPVGESVVLRDSNGNEVDSTSFLTDYYNDYRTWQRTTDASERWIFKSETAGVVNCFQPFPAKDIELWYNTLYDATMRALSKVGQDVFDLNSLAALIKNIITETVQIVAEILGRMIVEMSLFIELALQDYSQSISGGMRLSLVITGDGVRDALLWISSAVQQAIAGITNPTQVTLGRRPIDTILDDVHIRFSAYASAGLPRILSDILPGAEFRLAGSIQVNLASFILPESGHQNWAVSFGVLFEEVPGRLLSMLYPVDSEKSADCWLFKAIIRAEPIDSANAIAAT